MDLNTTSAIIIGSILIFRVLYINVLNCRYFHEITKFWKNEKMLKRVFIETEKTFINVYYNYVHINMLLGERSIINAKFQKSAPTRNEKKLKNTKMTNK